MSQGGGRGGECSLSVDGYYQGPGGFQDMAWLLPYAVSDLARDHLAEVWKSATTALLGRTNAEGFVPFWSQAADQADADPRDRAYGAWLRDAEKVVLSSTLTEAPWERTRIFDEAAEDVVDRLEHEDGGASSCSRARARSSLSWPQTGWTGCR